MSGRVRTALLVLAGLVLVWPVWRVASALPPFGAPTAAYGTTVDRLGPPLRHVSNMVSAVNFDFRGLDTLGEEYMLLCAVTGAVLLLRGTRGEDSGDRAVRLPGRPHEDASDAITLVGRLFGPLTILFGLYMVLHATVSPGGGFQGGVVIASGLVFVYLGEGYRPWRRAVPSRVFELMEGFGAFLFALAGLWPLVCGKAFMENILPLGKFRDMLSGGLMLVENIGVAFAVTGGFANLFLEFMEETRAPKKEEKAE
ncbi:MAG: MnhB domain-containing protein [Rhizomicrobium sp.]